MHEHIPTDFLGMLIGIIKHTVMIAFFVMVMMMVIEYVNVQTKGSWKKHLSKKGFSQILFGALLGVVPGCLGTFLAVSLYTHGFMSFAALVTVMIATSGDEAFIMFSAIPETALIISAVIVVIAIISGVILQYVFKYEPAKPLFNHATMHPENPTCVCYNRQLIWPQLKKISFERAMLIFGLLAFAFVIAIGEIGPHEWNWKRVTFLIVSFIALAIVTTVPNHFLKEHLWEHIIKKHLLRIFLWTFGAFLLIHGMEHFWDIDHWVKENLAWVLILAVLIGIIPESGPHIVFITLFMSGTIPFSILLANSIVQDGHGSIPLLAESPRDFIKMKAINVLVGLIVGGLGIAFGF